MRSFFNMHLGIARIGQPMLLLIGALLIVQFFSCVPNQRIVYLQNEADPRRGAVDKSDGPTRTYGTYKEAYRLRSHDIISLRVGSITPSEFNFVKKYEEQLGLIRRLNQYDQAQPEGGQQQRMMMGGQGMGGEEGMLPIILDRQQTGFSLDSRGNLELPVIGEVSLEGLTLSEAEDLIKSRLQGYFETPVVRLQLLNFHFTIVGEVHRPGRYTSFDPEIHVFDAIVMAHHLTDFADRSRLKIIRYWDNQAEVMYLNTLREDILEQPNFYLQPNDMIVVPPLPARSARMYTLPSTSAVIGAVSGLLSLSLLIFTVLERSRRDNDQ